MAPWPGEVMWRASKRASALAREQGEALGARGRRTARQHGCPVEPIPSNGMCSARALYGRRRKMVNRAS
jgi:hypothetical protein